jgi:hypothetical protein
MNELIIYNLIAFIIYIIFLSGLFYLIIKDGDNNEIAHT